MKIIINVSRKRRAEALGFNTSRIWWHGGFEDFHEFDPKRSGSGTFNFASTKEFAEDYARTRSQDEGLDADIVVRPFYLTKKLFNFKNKSHLKRLSHILPKELTITGNYGWSAWSDGRVYIKEELLEAIQGISVPYTGLDEATKEAIRNGAKMFIRESERDYVINYDPNTDTVEYAPGWALQTINSLKAGIAFMEEHQPNYFQIPLKILELKQKEKDLKTYKINLNPPKRSGFNNWEILESTELRPYLIKLGFEGALMQEKKKETCCVFDARYIRSVDAEFKLKNSRNIMASVYAN